MNAAVTGIAFARVQQQEPTFVPLGDDLGLSQKDTTVQAQLARTKTRDTDTWEALLAHWDVCLTALANDFAAGEAAVDPLPQACNYCKLASVCRIHEGASSTTEGLVPSEDLH
jgi:ATP-dependent helicase/DNAse subunit B